MKWPHDILAERRELFPLPQGEGQGEGEGSALSQDVRIPTHLSLTPALSRWERGRLFPLRCDDDRGAQSRYGGATHNCALRDHFVTDP